MSRPDQGPIRIRLMSDYVDWPLWARSGPLTEDALPLPTALRDRITRWHNWSYGPGESTWEPPAGLTAVQQEDAWTAEGEALRTEIQTALGEEYEVAFVE